MNQQINQLLQYIIIEYWSRRINGLPIMHQQQIIHTYSSKHTHSKINVHVNATRSMTTHNAPRALLFVAGLVSCHLLRS